MAGNSNSGRSRLILLLKIALAAGIVAWLCTGRLDLHKLANVPLDGDLALLLAILLGSMFVPAVRWWWLLRIQQIEVSLWQATKMSWVGYAAALILPGAASGDLAKSLLILHQQTNAKARSLSTVLVDRIIGIYGLVLLGALSAVAFKFTHPGTHPLDSIAFMLFALLAGSTLAVVLALVGPIQRILARIMPLAWGDAWAESYQHYHRSKSALFGCLMLSLVASALTAASLAAADRVLGGAVSWMASLLVGPLVVLANCLPLTPGGIGVAEATASELFNQVGSPNGAEMMLAIRLGMAILSLPALIIMFGGRATHAQPSFPSTVEAIQDTPLAGTPERVQRAA